MPVVTEDLIIKNFNLYLEELAVKRGGFKIGEAPEVGASTNASEFAGALATELNKDWPFFTNITPRTTVLCEENVKEGEYAEKFLTKECLDNLKDNLKGNKEAFRKFIDYSRQKEYEKVLEAAQKAEKVTQNNDIEACFTKYSASYNFREALAELDKSLGTSSDSFAEAKEAMKQESKGFSGAISTVASNETPDLPQLHLSKLLEIGTKIGYISEYAHIKSQVDKVQVLIDFFFDKRNLSQQGAEAQETISHDDFCRDIEAIREAEETAEKLASLIDIFRDGQSEPCSIDEDKNVTFDLSRVEVNIDSALAEEGAFNLGESEPFVINLDDLKLAAAAAAAEKKVIKALIAGCKALENECLEDGVGYDRVTDIRGKVAKFAEKIGDEYKEELESYMEKIDEKEQSFFIAGDVELAKLILSAQKAESEEIIRQLLEAKVSKLETAAQALEEAQRLALESASAAEQAQTAQLAQHTAALTAERKRSESDIASLTTKYDKSVKELGQKLKEGEEAAEQAAAAATAALETQHAAALEDAEEAARGQEVELSAQKQVTKKAAAAVMKTALTGISQSRVRQGFGAWKQETKALQEAERSVVQEKAHAAELSAQAAAQAVQAELQGKLSASAAALEALRVEHAAAQEQNARIVEELSALNTRVVANIDSELVTLRDQKGALEAELAAEQAASTQATAAAAAHAAALEAQAASQVAEFGAEQARATAAAQAQVVAAREELETLRAAHEAALAEQAAQQAAAAAQTQQAEETARLAVEQAASTQAAEAAEQAAAAATAALEAARVAKEQATAALETQVAELEGIKADHALAIGALRSTLDGNQRELSQEKIKALEMETSLELLRGKDTEGLLDEKHADQQALITELQLRLKKQEDHAREYIPSLSKMVGEVSEERDGVIRELETSQAGFRSLTQENDNLKLAIEGKDRVMAGLESHTDRDDDLQRKEEEAKEERESLIRDLEYSVTKAEEENADLHRQIGAKDVEILHLQTQSGSSTHSLAAGDGDSAGGSKGRKAVGSSDGSRALDGLAETTVDVSDDSSLEEGDPGQSRGGSSGSHSLDSTAKLTDELTTLRAQVDQMNVANADRRLETERHRIAAGREVALSKHESEVKIAETQAKAQLDVEALRSRAEERMLASEERRSAERLSAERLLIQQAELRAQESRVQQARLGRFQERKLEQIKAQSSERARMVEVAQQAREDAVRVAEQVQRDAVIEAERVHHTAFQAAGFAETKRQEDQAEQASDTAIVNTFIRSLAAKNKAMTAEVAKLSDLLSLDVEVLRKLYDVKSIAGSKELKLESIDGFKLLAHARKLVKANFASFDGVADSGLDVDMPDEDVWKRVQGRDGDGAKFSTVLGSAARLATTALANAKAIDVIEGARQALYKQGVNIDNNPKAFTDALKAMPAFEPDVRDAISAGLDEMDLSGLRGREAREVMKNVAEITTKLGGEHNFVDFVIRNYESLGEKLIANNVGLITKYARDGEDLIELLGHVKNTDIKDGILGNSKAADLIVRADPKGAVLRKYLSKSDIDKRVAIDLVEAYSEDVDQRARIEKRAHKDDKFADKLEDYGFEFEAGPSKIQASDTHEKSYSAPSPSKDFKAEPTVSMTTTVLKGGVIAGVAGIAVALLMFPIAGAAIGCLAFAGTCGYDKMTNDSIRTNNSVNYRSSGASKKDTQNLLIKNGADTGRLEVRDGHAAKVREGAGKGSGLSIFQ